MKRLSGAALFCILYLRAYISFVIIVVSARFLEDIPNHYLGSESIKFKLFAGNAFTLSQPNSKWSQLESQAHPWRDTATFNVHRYCNKYVFPFESYAFKR